MLTFRTCALGMALLALAACGDPLARVERLEDVAIADSTEGAPETTAVSAAPEEIARRPGLFGLLRGSPVDGPAEAEAGAEAVAAEAPEATDAPETTYAPEAAQPAATPVAAAPEPARRGLFGRLVRNASTAAADAAQSDAAADAAPIAAVEPASAPAPEPAAEPRRGGLFGGNRAAGPRIDPDAPDALVVSYGTAIPYGQIARVCDAPRGGLGREIARWPERRPVYRMYDSKPDQTGLRTHYITGFKDDCARQFTAALALFGAPDLHEQLRYGLPSKVQPYSRTDEAYEGVKSRVCRVGKGKPCGARIDRLAQNTVFVSTYERFQGSPLWANILLHAGEVVEKDKVTN